MISFEDLFSAPHRANFTSIVPIPHKAPDIVIEGLKMWSTELGLIISLPTLLQRLASSLFITATRNRYAQNLYAFMRHGVTLSG